MKHAPHAWYENIDHFFVNLSFKRCEFDHNIYVLHVHGDTLIVALHVDDLVITGNNANLILGMKKQLVDTFEMTNLGLLHFFLHIQILQMDGGIFLSQPKYALDLLKGFKMDNFKSCATPYQTGVKLSKCYDSP